MSNRPTPTHLRVLAGNPGKRPLPAAEPDAGPMLLDTPEELSEGARPHWQRLAPMLAQSGVLRASDRDLLAIYCEYYAVHLECLRNGKPDKALAGQLRLMLGEMGMTPAARTRIVADKAPDNEQGKQRFFG